MATSRSFQAMLNEYLPNDLLKEELIKRDYVLQKVQKDNNWKGGKLIVPFRANKANSTKFGALTASNDIAEAQYIRGSIDDYVELWGSLIFNHRDLQEHNGRIPESTFLRILPDIVDEHMDHMKEVASTQLLNGSSFAVATDSTNANVGIFIVDRIDQFELNMKVRIDDDDSVAADAYVIAINQNTNSITLSDSRGGAAFDFSAYTVAQNAKFYFDGADATSFVSLRSALLSAANGGSANLHGVSKLAYPHLQAINVSGASITATNILDQIFDAYRSVRQKAKGKASDVVMSYKHLGSIMKLIEVQKGGYKVSEGSEKASIYGWTEIMITSVTGERLTFVGVQEMQDDVIMFLDWSGITFRSNGFFKKRKSPEGLEYFEVRNTSGYQYIVDSCLFGELEVRQPGHCGIIYGISY